MILHVILGPTEAGVWTLCRAVDFAEEFGISVRVDPLELGERSAC